MINKVSPIHYSTIDNMVFREKKSYLLGTDIIATPINTYNTFGFNLSMQNMSQYLLMYAPMLFMDKSYQNFLEYINKRKPRFSEKAKLNRIKEQFKKYFHSFLRESSDYETMLSLFDESGDKWTEITANMYYTTFNVVAKYVRNNDICKQFSELMCSYCWINYTDTIYRNIENNGYYVERDSGELATRNVFSNYLIDLIGGKCFYVDGKWKPDDLTQQIVEEIGEAISMYSKLVFKHLISMLDKYKQSNSVAL